MFSSSCRSIKILLPILIASSIFTSSMALSQEFPSKTVTLVVPFSAGGANDVNARFLAGKLSKLWGKSVIVENRGGAGSAIGTAHVVQSNPDGYTLLFTSTSLATSAATQSQLPYDPVKDLQPISLVGLTEQYVLVKEGSSIKTLKDLITQAEKRKIFSGTAGVGAIGHFTSLVLDDAIGIKSEIVQFTGGSGVLTDLGGGRIDTFVAAGEAAREGVQPIVVLSENRTASMPHVPTIVEEGYPEAVVDLWFGVLAPQGTPIDVVDKINRDIVMTMRESADDKFVKSQGLRISEASVEEFGALVASSVQRWTTVAEAKGIRQ